MYFVGKEPGSPMFYFKSLVRTPQSSDAPRSLKIELEQSLYLVACQRKQQDYVVYVLAAYRLSMHWELRLGRNS